MKKTEKNRRPAANREIDEKLYFLIEKKRALYYQYLRMTEKMRHSIEAGDINNLNGIISERKKCIRKVNRIDISVKKILKDACAMWDRLPLRIDSMIDDRTADLKEIAASIKSLDADLILAAQSASDVLKKDLLKIRNLRRANKNYGPHRIHSSKFVDIRN